MEFNITGLKQFYQKAQTELHDIRKLFKIRSLNDEIMATTPPLNKKVKKPSIRIHFEELCYLSKLSNQEVKQYFNFLKRRILEIETTIDKHFKMIRKVIR